MQTLAVKWATDGYQLNV